MTKGKATPASVFILEDHPATRQQLIKTVSQEPLLAVAGWAGSLEDANRWLDANEPPAVALVDLGLPDGEGVEFIARLQRLPVHVECLVITVFGDEKHVLEAVRAGASGYLLKDQRPKIARSILQVMDGGATISPSIAKLLLRQLSDGNPSADDRPPVKLTERELEVLQLTVKGYTHKEVATALGVSYYTVTSHVKHLYRKLSVHSRSEAVYEAVHLGLVDLGKEGTKT